MLVRIGKCLQRVIEALLLLGVVLLSIICLLGSLDDQVAFMTVAGLVLRLLQSIFGPMRSCSGHWFVQCGAMAANYFRS